MPAKIPAALRKRVARVKLFLCGVNGSFSLTPALSRWEREKRSQLFGGIDGWILLAVVLFFKIVQRLSPLPAGEGQGEGEALFNIFHL